MQETIENKIWTVLSLLQWTTDHLQTRGFDDARLNVELLLSHVLRCKRIDLYIAFDKPLSSKELAAFKVLLRRRLSHEPLQYILGEAEFMGLKFIVDRRVLIPRPETEVLVEQALKLAGGEDSVSSILDVGTGSGNIAVSAAKRLSACSVVATDVSSEALDVARMNAESNTVGDRIRLLRHDIFQSPEALPGAPYDLVLSNPPYVSEVERNSLAREILDYEPSIAVLEGGDGLRFYRRIIEVGTQLLKKNGSLLVEVAYDQSLPVSKMFSDAGYSDVQTIRDYSGRERVVQARWGS